MATDIAKRNTNDRCGCLVQADVGYGGICPPAASGWECEIANGSFVASLFKNAGFGGTTALEKADRPQRVGSTNSLIKEAAVQVDRRLSGSCPADCRPSLASAPRSVQAEQQADV